MMSNWPPVFKWVFKKDDGQVASGVGSCRTTLLLGLLVISYGYYDFPFELSFCIILEGFSSLG